MLQHPDIHYSNVSFFPLVRRRGLQQRLVARVTLATLLSLDLLHDAGTLLLEELTEGIVILEADAVRFHDVIVKKLRRRLDCETATICHP